MGRGRRWRIAFAAAGISWAVSFATASAQMWQWDVLTRTTDRTPVGARSSVVLSGRELRLTYAVNGGTRTVPITSCRADVADVAAVRVVTSEQQPFLYVVLRPDHPADCSSGRQPIALLPIAADPAAQSAVAAISRVCCRPIVARATPSPTPRPTVAPTPTPTATPAPTPAPAVPPAAWVENNGLFAFVRVRNRDARPLTIAGGEVIDCRNIGYGCGRFPGRTVASGALATLATIMSDGGRNAPAFSFRFDARIGAQSYVGSGLSTRRPDDRRDRMTADELRAAEAVAVAAAGGHLTPPPPKRVPARLVKRGTSTLGAGQAGIATVRVRIGTDGVPIDASIVSISNRALVAAALETAVSSTYTPATLDGRPEDADYLATFHFDALPVPVPSKAAGASPRPAPSQPGRPTASPNPYPESM